MCIWAQQAGQGITQCWIAVMARVFASFDEDPEHGTGTTGTGTGRDGGATVVIKV